MNKSNQITWAFEDKPMSPELKRALRGLMNHMAKANGLKILQTTPRQGGTLRKTNKNKVSFKLPKEYKPKSKVPIKDTVRIGDRVNLFKGKELYGKYVVTSIPDRHTLLLVCIDSGSVWHLPLTRECRRVSVFNIPLSVLLGDGMALKLKDINTLMGYTFTRYTCKATSTGITAITVRTPIR